MNISTFQEHARWTLEYHRFLICRTRSSRDIHSISVSCWVSWRSRRGDRLREISVFTFMYLKWPLSFPRSMDFVPVSNDAIRKVCCDNRETREQNEECSWPFRLTGRVAGTHSIVQKHTACDLSHRADINSAIVSYFSSSSLVLSGNPTE
jgi:hypothetical protein